MSETHQYIEHYNNGGLFVIKFTRVNKKNALNNEVNLFFKIYYYFDC